MFNDSKCRAGLKFAYAFANMPIAEFSLSLFLFLNACQKPMDDVRYMNPCFVFFYVILLVSTHLFILSNIQ
jgi:heme/copper-type cytochrome/quinol oxidase subunit 4